ncbi:hypothetical protein ACFPA8_17490 [Streptomyces ovatisporus]|uniref:Uncharacterized protein n=1 Tax=Streptomyces ovatisporus TaxID=1128682 RepID=A0ABV9A8Y9_9ACTN
MLLWCLALGGLFMAFVSLSVDQRALATVGFVLVIVCPGLAEAYAQRRRRSDWFRQQFGTQEEFVRSLDTEGLRRVRDEKGLAEAVRELRRRHPKLPLKTAADTVKQL